VASCLSSSFGRVVIETQSGSGSGSISASVVSQSFAPTFQRQSPRENVQWMIPLIAPTNCCSTFDRSSRRPDRDQPAHEPT
jgi:hypothetical protein